MDPFLRKWENRKQGVTIRSSERKRWEIMFAKISMRDSRKNSKTNS